jgi:uncharacterized radical SAM superfamily Fe-S cluster-containing enzyme
LKAQLFRDDDEVVIRKVCPIHGVFEDVIWSDYGMYLKANRFEHIGEGLWNPRTERTEKGCPFDCGICNEHKSHTALAIIDVTMVMDSHLFAISSCNLVIFSSPA